MSGQPSDVCADCGRKYGLGKDHKTRVVTVWIGDCDVCGAVGVACVAARDFGYLAPEWATHEKGAA